jgi:dipeptidyl aminopeptidase/acylaminoacyl peptidase
MMLATMDKADGLEGDGGHADQSSKVQAAVSFVGPTDLTVDDLPEASRTIIKNWLGGDLKEKAAEAKKASPITYVDKSDAPILMFHGTVDPLIPNTQAYRMAEAMTKVGVKGRIELIMGAGHGWGGKEMERTLEEMVRFFDEHLKPAPF